MAHLFALLTSAGETGYKEPTLTGLVCLVEGVDCCSSGVCKWVNKIEGSKIT